MTNSTDDFEKLRKLLKLKRHEQPPPGYFNGFSNIVIRRLEAEGQSAPGEGLWTEVAWLRKIFGLFESSPITAGVFGAGLCGLVIAWVAISNQVEKPPGAYANTAPKAGELTISHDSVAMNVSQSEVFGRSMNPNAAGSPFGGGSSMTALVEPVNFSPAAH